MANNTSTGRKGSTPAKDKELNKRSNSNKLVLVPDACTLDLSAAMIPDHFFKPSGAHALKKEARPETFFDMYFDFLPRDKVKGIHMLDIVAGELFAVKPQGECFDADLQKSIIDPVRARMYKRIFIEKNTPVTVIHTDHGSQLVDIYAELKAVETRINTYIRSLDHNDKTKDKERDMRQQLRKLRHTLGKDRGEKIITEYLMEHRQPTFFISDDKKGRRDAVKAGEHNNHACVYVDNTIGFLGILKKAGVFEAAGFQPWVTPEVIMKEMAIQKKEHQLKSTDDRASPNHTAIAGRNSNAAKPCPPEQWFSR